MKRREFFGTVLGLPVALAVGTIKQGDWPQAQVRVLADDDRWREWGVPFTYTVVVEEDR